MDGPEKKAKIVARKKLWQQNNREKVNAAGRAYYQANRGKVDAKNRKWVKDNREEFREICRRSEKKNRKVRTDAVRQWRHENKEFYATRQAEFRTLRLAKEGNTKPSWFNAFDLNRIMENQLFRCVYCPVNIKENFHFDHRVPFILAGGGNKENIQILCADCNFRKGVRTHKEFLKIKTIERENANKFSIGCFGID